MAAKKRSTNTRKDEIRCAMTDDEFHKVVNSIVEAETILAMLDSHGTKDRDRETIVAITLIEERLEKAQSLLNACWDKTREAAHG